MSDAPATLATSLDWGRPDGRALVASNGSGLVRYEAACRALAEAKSVDEVKAIRDAGDAMRTAAHIAKNKQLEVDAAEIRIRAERRLGELMAAQRETVGLAKGGQPYQATGFKSDPVEPAPTLSEAGIDKNLADRARKLAAVPEEEFEQTVSDWRGRVEQETERVTVDLLKSGEKHIRGTFGTGDNEWYTPEQYLAAARDVLGGFDLDPASSDAAQQIVQAGRYFTQEDDGLQKEWRGSVWLNPPFAQPFIAQFVSKLVDEIKSGRVPAAIMLTHNYTDTSWFHEAVSAASAICFTRGRVKFHDGKGAVAAPTQGQAFFYFGDDIAEFVKRFGDIGFVVMPYWREVQ